MLISQKNTKRVQKLLLLLQLVLLLLLLLIITNNNTNIDSNPHRNMKTYFSYLALNLSSVIIH